LRKGEIIKTTPFEMVLIICELEKKDTFEKTMKPLRLYFSF